VGGEVSWVSASNGSPPAATGVSADVSPANGGAPSLGVSGISLAVSPVRGEGGGGEEAEAVPEDLLREQERLRQLRRHSEASQAPLSFRSILKTHLPFREEWEKRVSAGQSLGNSRQGGGGRAQQELGAPPGADSQARWSLPERGSAGGAVQIKSRLAMELEKQHASAEEQGAGEAEAFEDRTSRRFSGMSAVSDVDDLTLWT